PGCPGVPGVSLSLTCRSPRSAPLPPGSPAPCSPPSVSILVGAPKANTSQPNVTQGGAVFHCPWPPGGDCTPIDFDHIGTRTHDFGGNSSDAPEPVEFKSLQWFGATVRAHNGSILACAPLYSWSPPKEEGGAREPVGSCFLSIGNFSKFVEYAPCRSDLNSAAGQGYCQGGFSAEFTQVGARGGSGGAQGQVMSATQEQIAAGNFPEYLIQEVPGQLQTRQAAPSHDDSYMGYSVAVGEFSGDTTQDFVAGVPKGNLTYGYVTILNGTNMRSLYNFSGEQMASYFGYAVAATDVNNDGLTDLLVGAPLFMARSGAGGARELGRVYLYLQRGGAPPAPPAPLTGTHEFGRFGSAIAPLGDLDRDGFNDVAVGAPLGAEGRRGLVFIFRGGGAGLRPRPAQVLRGLGGPRAQPDFFGAALRGATDLDGNGYPDLLVGAFGADAALVYRGRPIVHASATLAIVPTMFNPEERGCRSLGSQNTLGAPPGPLLSPPCHSGDPRCHLGDPPCHLPATPGTPPCHSGHLVPHGPVSPRCPPVPALSPCPQNESEFRDKLSPIPVSLSLALDPAVSPPPPGLAPLLSPATRTRLEAKAHIQLDCGEDNVCVPDLQLEATADRRAVFLGDRNSLNVTFHARNVGEGGAYEAELHVRPPPGALYSGVLRPHGNFSALSCELGGGNASSSLVCDLGNPMKAGASIRGGLRFTLPQLSDSSGSVRFELQIRSKNANNSQSAVVPVALAVRAATRVSVLGVSRPDVVTIPEGGWGPDPPQRLQDLGPPVEHVYEVGTPPGSLSPARGSPCPQTWGPHVPNPAGGGAHAPPPAGPRVPKAGMSPHPRPQGCPPGCPEAECFRLSCPSGGLERQQRVSLRLTFRLRTPPLRQVRTQNTPGTPPATLKTPPGGDPAGDPAVCPRAQVVTALSWARPEAGGGVPVWVVVLAVLLGLLLLGLLCYGLYKLGFFKRSGPYGTAMEKAQLKPQAASEA
uniref:Integrin subunit alpha 5 n=1 Tax=Corvus moneduloides TaxID=1196302 RepID=A0A8U7NC98_CORMO